MRLQNVAYNCKSCFLKKQLFRAFTVGATCMCPALSAWLIKRVFKMQNGEHGEFFSNTVKKRKMIDRHELISRKRQAVDSTARTIECVNNGNSIMA